MKDLDTLVEMLTPNELTQDLSAISLTPLNDLYKWLVFKTWELPIYRLSKAQLEQSVIPQPIDTPQKYLQVALFLMKRLQEFTQFYLDLRALDEQLSYLKEDVDGNEYLKAYFDLHFKLKELKDRWSEIKDIKSYLSNTKEFSLYDFEQSFLTKVSDTIQSQMSTIERDINRSRLMETTLKDISTKKESTPTPIKVPPREGVEIVVTDAWAVMTSPDKEEKMEIEKNFTPPLSKRGPGRPKKNLDEEKKTQN
jgi:hypothetical protein